MTNKEMLQALKVNAKVRFTELPDAVCTIVGYFCMYENGKTTYSAIVSPSKKEYLYVDPAKISVISPVDEILKKLV